MSSFSLKCQSEWSSFSSFNFLYDVATYESKTYICNSGGLLVLDNNNNSDELLTPANSSLVGHDMREIEFLSNGDAWLLSDEGGLLYYDGQDFTSIKIGNRPTNLRIQQDNLWFIDDDALWSYIDQELTQHPIGELSEVNAMDIDSDGVLWLISDREDLVAYDGTDVILSINLPEEYSSLFYLGSNNEIWFNARTTNQNYICQFDRTNFSSYPTSEIIRGYGELTEGQVQFITQDDIGQIENGDIKLDSLINVYPELFGQTELRITGGQFNDGCFWFRNFVSPSSKLAKLTAETSTVIATKDTIVNFPKSIEQDCDGNIYYLESHNENLVRKYESDTWTTLPSDHLFRRMTDIRLNPHTCELWGFNSGSGTSLWSIQDEGIEEIEILPRSCSSITFDNEGNTYAACRDLFRINRNGATIPINFFDASLAITTDLVHYSTNGILWAIGFKDSDEHIFKFENDEWKMLNNSNTTGIAPDIDFWMHEDREGNMWFRSGSELMRYDGIRWRRFNIPLLRDNEYEVNSIAQDANGHYWLALDRNGLVFWDESATTHYTVFNSGLLSNRCEELELVNDTELWIRHSDGISILDVSSFSSTQTPPTAIHDAPPPFILYPNPSSGLVHIENETIAERHYEVYSTNGELLSRDHSDKKLWSITLRPGMYFMKVISKYGEQVKKLIITRP